MSYKRINLSFDLRRDRDMQAYAILSSKKHKTDYVVDLLLNNEGIVNQNISKEVIKQALREVLGEMNITIDENKKDRDEDIPEEVFDIFKQI
ncbi:hypothetical protein [uncultured Tissierella sp.]|uniref:hypothetical protein n=1 Tax=uncultured Tissierella sp. TaxID=448160 RepID=UPI0028043D2F|nr:hypothetical protein [uncultured Tissierella sp.]MDU5082730.1 hypothetical protein [Bacillota bacterium]